MNLNGNARLSSLCLLVHLEQDGRQSVGRRAYLKRVCRLRFSFFANDIGCAACAGCRAMEALGPGFERRDASRDGLARRLGKFGRLALRCSRRLRLGSGLVAQLVRARA